MSSELIAKQTEKTECEVCTYVFDSEKFNNSGHKEELGPCKLYGTIVMCPSCLAKEIEFQSPKNQEQRLNDMNVILKSRAIDDSIQVRTDLFNAATVSIVDLKKAIDSDDTIENKPYRLAEELKRRFEHFKTVVFELNEQIVAAGNQQKAIQVYLNQMANQLRIEEREKLKIADINYKPQPVKVAKPKNVVTTGGKRSSKMNKEELKKYAMELGIPEFTLQMLVVSKGITVEQAANMLRKSINEAKLSSNQ